MGFPDSLSASTNTQISFSSTLASDDEVMTDMNKNKVNTEGEEKKDELSSTPAIKSNKSSSSSLPSSVPISVPREIVPYDPLTIEDAINEFQKDRGDGCAKVWNHFQTLDGENIEKHINDFAYTMKKVVERDSGERHQIRSSPKMLRAILEALPCWDGSQEDDKKVDQIFKMMKQRPSGKGWDYKPVRGKPVSTDTSVGSLICSLIDKRDTSNTLAITFDNDTNNNNNNINNNNDSKKKRSRGRPRKNKTSGKQNNALSSASILGKRKLIFKDREEKKRQKRSNYVDSEDESD